MLNNYPKKNSHTEWEEDFVKTLNKHAPLKTKVIRGNRKSFITKNLRKAIMKRSALKKRANVSNNPEIIKLYKKQRNYVVNLSRKVKKEYFQKHMLHGASSNIFGNFANHSFQIKQIILTTKLYWWKKEK